MPRVLVVLPTQTYRARDFLEAAEALGVDLAIASEEALPSLAADRFVLIDCDDHQAAADAIIALGLRTPLDAIVSSDDRGLQAAAIAAEALGLPHHSPAAVAATLDKIELRRRLSRAEVPQPEFRVLGIGGDPATVVAGFESPVVIKAATLSASRGVIRVDDPEQASPVVNRIRAILGDAGHQMDEELLVERYVDGPEVAVEAMVWEGKLELLAIFDKPDPLVGPFFEETIYVTPSRADQPTQAEIVRVTELAATAIGLSQGPLHAELRLPGGRPSIIELAGRTIGGVCGRSLRFGLTGTRLETLVLRQALGLRKPMRRAPGASGVMMLPIPGAGILRQVTGIDECLAVPGITDLEMAIRPGETLVPLPEGDRYLGFLFARADTPQEVEAALRCGHRQLGFVVDRYLPRRQSTENGPGSQIDNTP